MEDNSSKKWLVGVVGPCASGKSTLITTLKIHGVEFRHIAQEHSYVPTMWKRLTNPDLLVFLDASYTITCQRRRLNWTEAEYAEQHRRLSHARQNADLYLLTDNLTPEDVRTCVIDFLKSNQIMIFDSSSVSR